MPQGRSPLVIEPATLLPGAQRWAHRTASEVWYADVLTAAGTSKAFLKMQPANQVYAELVCTALGRAVGLPMPRPFRVRVERELLPDSAEWAPDETIRIAFASEDLAEPRLVDVIRVDGLDQWWPRLRQWSRFSDTALFDEWVANDDRSAHNLVCDGRGGFWLIDHGHAFGGDNWTPARLRAVANPVFDNRLLAMCAKDPAAERHGWRALALNAAQVYATWAAEFARAYPQSDAMRDAVLFFLQARAASLVRMICARLGLPELEV